MFGHGRVITSDSLTHCDPVTSYDDLNFNQHWLSLWLHSSRHYTTTRTNIELPSHVFVGIHIRANPQEVFRFYVFMISTILLRGQWVNRDTIIYICLRVNNVLSIRVGKRGSCGPFNSHGSTLMQTWISNCRHYFAGDKILIQSQTSTIASLKFENGSTISFHKLLAMWLLIHAGIKVKHVS